MVLSPDGVFARYGFQQANLLQSSVCYWFDNSLHSTLTFETPVGSKRIIGFHCGYQTTSRHKFPWQLDFTLLLEAASPIENDEANTMEIFDGIANRRRNPTSELLFEELDKRFSYLEKERGSSPINPGGIATLKERCAYTQSPVRVRLYM